MVLYSQTGRHAGLDRAGADTAGLAVLALVPGDEPDRVAGSPVIPRCDHRGR